LLSQSRISLLDHARMGFERRSQYEHPKHPPDKEYRYDGSRDANYPVASCFRFPKIEHAARVAGPVLVALYRNSEPPC
jgi:hypothetical protein